MVTKEEIQQVAKLMKIELEDHAVHIDRVQKMIDYFDILDKADVESEELTLNDISVEQLRTDKFIPYTEKLIEKLKNYKGTYIKAPKMI